MASLRWARQTVEFKDNSTAAVRPSYEQYCRAVVAPEMPIGIPSEVFHQKYAKLEAGSNQTFGPSELLQMEKFEKHLADLRKLGFTVEDQDTVRLYLLRYGDILPTLIKFASEICLKFGNTHKKIVRIWQSREDPSERCLAIRIYTPSWKKEFLRFIDSLYSLPESEIFSKSDGWVQVGFEHEL